MTDEDGRQAHAFVLGLCNRPHWVRLAGGGPGNCLVGVVYGSTRFWYIFFCSTHGGGIPCTRVRFVELVL